MSNFCVGMFRMWFTSGYNAYPFFTAVDPKKNPLPKCLVEGNSKTRRTRHDARMPILDNVRAVFSNPGYLTLPGKFRNLRDY